MSWIECPTRSDIPAYSYKIALESVLYTLTFTFNDRMKKWILTLADQQNNTLISPVPITVSLNLFGRFVNEGLPLGEFWAIDTSGKNIDPDRFELGERVRLLYRESTT